MFHTIRGYHDDNFGPAVNCILELPTLNISPPVLPFLLDSGSSVSVLSNYYARVLDIDYNNINLRKDIPLTGVGGSVDSYLVETAHIIFVTESNVFLRKNFNPWKFRITKVEHDKPKIREEIINKNQINIIGRDIFLVDGVKFTYSSNEVILELETV